MGFEFLLLIGLAVWVLVQQRRIGQLSRDLQMLTRRVQEPTQPRAAPAETPMPQPANETLPELLLTQVVEDDPPVVAPETIRPRAPEPTPLAPEKLPELLLTQVVAPEMPPTPATAPAAMPAPKRRAPNLGGKSLEQWLAENGLAWLAGGAVALSGILLVGWAAQQSFFTPLLRIYAALALGLGVIGASEYVRSNAKKTGGHPLAAALLAGAGAATLYGASWAAYGIYGYIALPAAVVALSVCAMILLALSFRHGEALGVLAIAAALTAPILCSAEAWPVLALMLYLIAVGTAGFIVAGLQRWSWVAGATTLGAYVWFAVSLADNSLPRALAMLNLTAIGGWALGHRAPDEKAENARWNGVQEWLPSIALGLSALLNVLCWSHAAQFAHANPVGPALIGVFIAGLCALAVRGEIARPAALMAAIAALPIGVLAFGQHLAAPAGLFWSLICAGSAAGAALAVAPRSLDRTLLSFIGAVSTLFILTLAAIMRPVWTASDVWGALAIGGLLMGLAARYMARSASDATKDWSVDFWSGAGALAILLALEAFSIPDFKPAADALAALAFAGAFLRLGWRALGSMAALAGALALTHALSPAFTGAAWSGALNIWRASEVLAVAALALSGASWVTHRRSARAQIAEALGTLAILTGLLGALLLLHFYAAGAGRLDALSENAMRALMLIAAGFVAIPRQGQTPGMIARWRGHVLMLAGLLYALLASVFSFNPWWGAEPAQVAGAPLFNIQALAFAAPAALAFLAANRLYLRNLPLARLYAILGAVFAMTWLALEIRRAFHSADLASGAIGLLEGDAFALAALLGACATVYWARKRAVITGDQHPFTHDLMRLTSLAAFAGLGVGAFFLLADRNAWWGAQDAARTDALATGLATLAQAPAAALAVLIGASLPTRASKASFTAASAASLFALSFGFLLLRWAHHQGAMDNQPPLVGIEGLLYALWPMAFIGAGAAFSAWLVRREQTRELALDFDAIWGVAAWPALIFGGVALWALFNPWRGLWPAQTFSALPTLAGLACYLGAAWLSLWLARVRIIADDPLFSRAAKIAAILHLFAAAMLIVRRGFHGADMGLDVEVTSFESWTYSVVWAVFAAAVWRYGVWRNDAVVRWTGLMLLIAVAAKVLLIDTSQFSPFVRALIILPVVLALVTIMARKLGPQRQP